MTFMQRLKLKKIASKLVIQSHTHRSNIIEMYKIIREAAGEEFTEDSPISLDIFMQECFEEAQAVQNLTVEIDHV